MIEYPEQLAALTATDPGLVEQLARLQNLAAILKWAPTAGVPLAEIDLVQQDEYSHDALLLLPDRRWLVFGVT
ncbi:MAG TPA: hypothetical protein VKE74_17360 [Gemmataceae bacterium]|nr:hypothetical protein [Gemmataceae bacterium]